MMYCIGLTGTIASGKSAAIAYFKTLGIDTLSADDIAKQLTCKNSPAFTEICQHFGSNILTADGDINRRQLRNHIMNHPIDRLWLENLLHPLIRQRIELSITQCHGPYCVIEIPLLNNRKTFPYLNRVLLITSEPQQQIARLMARDNCLEAEAKALLEHQKSNNNREALADDILLNSGSIDAFHNALNALHHRYLDQASILNLGT